MVWRSKIDKNNISHKHKRYPPEERPQPKPKKPLLTPEEKKERARLRSLAPKVKWRDEWVIDAYLLARDGHKARYICKVLGININRYRWLKKEKSVFKMAILRGIEDGKINKDSLSSFSNYVYGKLSPELQDLWWHIEAVENEPNGLSRIEAMFAKKGMYARMHLFIHALICRNFNMSAACQAVGISFETANQWMRTEPGFGQLLEEIHIHKKNFFESHLVKLIKNGDSAATIFANKTFNRDRGYNEKVDIQHTHVESGNIDITKLDLPLDVKKMILEAVRKLKEQEKQGANGETLPALEYKKVGDKAVPIEDNQ